MGNICGGSLTPTSTPTSAPTIQSRQNNGPLDDEIGTNDFDIDTNEEEQDKSSTDDTIDVMLWIVIGSSILLIAGIIVVFILCCKRKRKLKQAAEEPNSPTAQMVDQNADDDYWASKMRQLDTEAKLSTGVKIEFDAEQQDEDRRGSI